MKQDSLELPPLETTTQPKSQVKNLANDLSP